ncbi:MAG: histidine phosphatase family protein [Kofleriaceae bacterium]
MPSDVFLIRHANAVATGSRDDFRHLTPLGRDQARALGDRLRWHDCEPTHIWTSPLVRAVQTAELVISTLAVLTPIEVMPDLAHSGDPDFIVKAVNDMPEDTLVMLFGHQPTITWIASQLAGGDLAPMRNAEAIRIHHGRVRWRFAWDAEAPDKKL